MNDLMVSLPAQAVQIEKDVISLPVINVIDDRTNIAAAENLKIVSKFSKEFDEACEPERIRLRTPLDNFLALKKTAKDKIESWINQQKQSIGSYAQKVMKEANEKRRLEQERLNAEEKARVDKINEQRRLEAEQNGTEAVIETAEPVQEAVQIEQVKDRSVFVSTTVKEKPKASVIDRIVFIQTLTETGNAAWVNLIFDKVNESKLNEFCKAMEIDGTKKKFPGLSVDMVADVKVR